MTSHRRLAGAALALALGASTSAQQPATKDQPDTPRFQSRVELIQLDVSVLDRGRKPVTGLTASDFTVLENGVERPIRAFAPVTLPRRAGPAPGPPPVASPSEPATNEAGEQEGRLVIILMDRTIPPGEPTVTARRVASAAIEALGPTDLAAVVTTGGGTPQMLTSDRGRLIAAVNGSDWSTGVSKEQDDILASLPLIGRDDPVTDGRCLCGVCVLETLTRISDAVQSAPRRRKLLLFIGASVIFQVGPRMPRTDVGCSRRVIDAQRTLFDSLARSNLTVHSFDPYGLANIGAHTRAGSPGGRPDEDGPVVRRQRLQADTADHLRNQGSLEVLPELTGGRAVLNTNDPDAHVPGIFDETSSYYLLGFEPGPSRGANPRRSIEVKVARSSVTVVAQRQHVWTPVPAGSTALGAGSVLPASADEMLRSLLPVAAKPLAMSAAAFAGLDSDRARLSLIVDVSAFGRAGAAVPLEIAAMAVDRRGRQVAAARQTTTVEMPALVPGRSFHAQVPTHLDLPPGDYEIRVGVSDPTGVGASVFSQVTVPAFDSAPLSLSDVSLEMGRASARAPAGLTQGATTQRAFDMNEAVRAFLQIYQGTARIDPIVPVTVRARIVDRAGRVVRDQSGVLSEQGFSNRRTAVTLDLEELPPGEYVLTIEASTDRHQATRTLRFRVDRAR